MRRHRRRASISSRVSTLRRSGGNAGLLVRQSLPRTTK
jgi:hypothetical protein